MAFSKDVLEYVLPIPKNTILRDDWFHDQWIGNLVDRFGSVEFDAFPGLDWRKHPNGEGASGKRNPIKQLINRVVFNYSYFKRVIKTVHHLQIYHRKRAQRTVSHVSYQTE